VRTAQPRALACLLAAALLLAPVGKPAARAYDWIAPLAEQSQPDLFYNYYVPGAGGVPAAMYPAPYPVPPLVGHTYYTYQPLMPHEFLYQHHASYQQHYNNGMGLNRTKVRWYGTPVRTGVKGLFKMIEVPR